MQCLFFIKNKNGMGVPGEHHLKLRINDQKVLSAKNMPFKMMRHTVSVQKIRGLGKTVYSGIKGRRTDFCFIRMPQ